MPSAQGSGDQVRPLGAGPGGHPKVDPDRHDIADIVLFEVLPESVLRP